MLELRYQPIDPSLTVSHPTWDLVLSHCGRNLDETLASLPWAKSHGIYSGRDYLTMWIACMISDPDSPLPYLFFFGPQACGKSSFREAIELLVTKGCIRADHALTNTAGFNGEMYGAILCYVEETNLSNVGSLAYHRLKEYVTNFSLSIHRQAMWPFKTHNTTHWVQMAGDRSAGPAFPDGKRITAMHVQDLSVVIPKTTLMARLHDEGPHFMRTLVDLELPPVINRLRIPNITTEIK